MIEVKKPLGRPRKYFGSSTIHSTRTFYFPNNEEYNKIWLEFQSLCNKETPFTFVKNVKYRTGHTMRRSILDYVCRKSTNLKIKELALKALLVEINTSIKAYNKFKNINKELLSYESLEASFSNKANLHIKPTTTENKVNIEEVVE